MKWARPQSVVAVENALRSALLSSCKQRMDVNWLYLLHHVPCTCLVESSPKLSRSLKVTARPTDWLGAQTGQQRNAREFATKRVSSIPATQRMCSRLHHPHIIVMMIVVELQIHGSSGEEIAASWKHFCETVRERISHKFEKNANSTSDKGTEFRINKSVGLLFSRAFSALLSRIANY